MATPAKHEMHILRGPPTCPLNSYLTQSWIFISEAKSNTWPIEDHDHSEVQGCLSAIAIVAIRMQYIEQKSLNDLHFGNYNFG